MPDGTTNALVKLDHSETLSTSKTINALLLVPNRTQPTNSGIVQGDGGTATLTVTSGLIGFSSGTTSGDRMSAANLQLGTPGSGVDATLFTAPTATGAAAARIDSSITGSNQAGGQNIAKAGAGTLIFSGTSGNQFTGTLNINEGVLSVHEFLGSRLAERRHRRSTTARSSNLRSAALPA